MRRWVRSRSSGSACPRQERARTTSRKDGRATEVPESGRGCSPHLLTLRPEVREEDRELEASLSFSLKWAY